MGSLLGAWLGGENRETSREGERCMYLPSQVCDLSFGSTRRVVSTSHFRSGAFAAKGARPSVCVWRSRC